MREFFSGWRRKSGVVALLIVSALAIFRFHQKNQVQYRIRELLLQGQPLEFFIPVVRTTHSRTIEDQSALRELARTIVIWSFERMDGRGLSAGGTMIYIEPTSGTHFELLIGDTHIFARFNSGECYYCTVSEGSAMKKAADMAGFKYPLSYDFPPKSQEQHDNTESGQK